jgi:alginate O-acetyltransferase complex protein AlgI
MEDANIRRTPGRRDDPGWRRLAFVVLGTLLATCAIDLVLFYGDTYRRIIDPQSGAGSFERAIGALRNRPADARHDVLVLGDSRIYGGLDPRAADATAGGLRFLNAGVPGTDPRCWFFLARAIDPQANRFRAIVIPVDTYTDDTGAIGSLDADDHRSDVRTVLFETTPGDIVPLARSFDEPEVQREIAFDLAIRAPLLREDVQAMLADPAGRVAALRADDTTAFDPEAAHPFTTTLAGLQVDFARGDVAYPTWVPSAERTEIARQVLRVAMPSESYRAYRETWLGPIVRRYRAAHVPVIFVRIPARPAHRAPPAIPSGSIVAMAGTFGARIIPDDAYVALERPELFADHDHLDVDGSRKFSALLGRDVARMLAPSSVASAVPDASVNAGKSLDGRPATATAPTRARSLRALAHAFVRGLGIGVPMLFQSVDFALFLGIVLAAFYAAPRRLRPTILLVASYAFYLRWNAWYVVFLAFLTLTDFAIGRAIGDTSASAPRRRTLLALGIGFNLAFLGTFKYLNFGTGTIFALLGRSSDPWLLQLVVPVGISFHTFQSISYLVDVARGRTRPARSLYDYALYLAFFPQLLAGPIVRAGLFLGELLAWKPPAAADVERGMREIVLGLAKKLVLADQFAPVADAYFGAPAAPGDAVSAWCAALAFALQISFDFSGYSDIAIGSARLFGFAFPANFRRPYLAASVTEFWRRWHISLSTWLRDYLYIPLGGNRGSRFATYRNLFVTMLLGGLWHGANWTFVAWGAYHGIALALERATGTGRGVPVTGAARIVRVAATFVIVVCGWVLFRSQSFAQAFAVYRAMFAGGGGGAPTLPVWPLVLLAGAIAIGIAQERGAAWNWRTRPVALQIATLTGLLLLVEIASWPGPAAPFIYFKF